MQIKKENIANAQRELHSLQTKVKLEGRIFYSVISIMIAIGTALIILNSPSAKWQAWIIVGIFGIFGFVIAFNIIPSPLPPIRWSAARKKIDYLKGYLDGLSKKSKE